MSAALARTFLVVARESGGGGVVLCQNRATLVPLASQGRAKLSTLLQEDGPLDQDAVDVSAKSPVPWPMSAPIYGEGWRSYSRLMVPTYDMAADWTLETSKCALVCAATYSRNVYDFLSKQDSNTAYLLLVAKGKQSSDYLQGEMLKMRNRVIDEALALTAKTKEAVRSGKAKEMVAQRIEEFKSKSKDLMDLLQRKIKDNEELLQKINAYSKKSKDYTLDILKNSKLSKEFSGKSEQMIEKSKDKSVAVYEWSKEVSSSILNRTRLAGDSVIVRVTESYSQAPSMMIVIKNSRYVENVQEMLRALEPRAPKQDYTFVNKFLNRVEPNRISNMVQLNNKQEFASSQPKHEFHSSALQLAKPARLLATEYPQLWIFERSGGASHLHMTGEISALIPGPVKKIWRGLRDKSLPSWQATIASLLQRIQDTLVKKKK